MLGTAAVFETDGRKALKEWTSKRLLTTQPLMKLTYNQCQTVNGCLLVCKPLDGVTFWPLSIRLWHIGNITQYLGQRLLSMWHAIGSTTVISFNTSTQYWSLACMAAEARKMDRHISALEYQLQGTMATMTQNHFV
jgi:hypothetical protein